MRSIEYQNDLLNRGVLRYAFRAKDGFKAVLMFELNTLEELDALVKRDPGWPYSHARVVPVVTTESLVREAQEYLGETILSDNEVQALDIPRQKIEQNSQYWLAWKEVKPFSPLLPDVDQNDVYRRTLIAQKSHGDPVEFSDENPVGLSVGILIAHGDLEATRRHIETCDVFPDTIVEYTELLPLQMAWEAARAELARLRRPCNQQNPFVNTPSHINTKH
jgi:muconolactone delta-isomerase